MEYEASLLTGNLHVQYLSMAEFPSNEMKVIWRKDCDASIGPVLVLRRRTRYCKSKRMGRLVFRLLPYDKRGFESVQIPWYRLCAFHDISSEVWKLARCFDRPDQGMFVPFQEKIIAMPWSDISRFENKAAMLPREYSSRIYTCLLGSVCRWDHLCGNVNLDIRMIDFIATSA